MLSSCTNNKQKKKKMAGNFVVFDTETTGLTPDGAQVGDGHPGWELCRLVEIGWLVYDQTYQLLDEGSFIVQPNGFTISPESIKIHRISQQKAIDEGVPLSDALSAFMRSLHTHEVKRLVAHNALFDYQVVAAELHRLGWTAELDYLTQIQRYCTARSANINRFRNFVSLKAAFKRLVPSETQKEAHRAAADALMCAKVYFALNPRRPSNVQPLAVS